MAEQSFTNSKARLAARRLALSSAEILAEEDARASQLYASSGALHLDSTAVAEQRPLTALRYSPCGRLLATGRCVIEVVWAHGRIQEFVCEFRVVLRVR